MMAYGGRGQNYETTKAAARKALSPEESKTEPKQSTAVFSHPRTDCVNSIDCEYPIYLQRQPILTIMRAPPDNQFMTLHPHSSVMNSIWYKMKAQRWTGRHVVQLQHYL